MTPEQRRRHEALKRITLKTAVNESGYSIAEIYRAAEKAADEKGRVPLDAKKALQNYTERGAVAEGVYDFCITLLKVTDTPIRKARKR